MRSKNKEQNSNVNKRDSLGKKHLTKNKSSKKITNDKK